MKAPQAGQKVRLRSRTWLVESLSGNAGQEILDLACLEDDAQGEQLRVLWPLELDRQILEREAWERLGDKGFDAPNMFAAYLRTLRWNCVTATDPTLFQSPFRAGIRLDAYQIEPLRKALLLPRVNLFIADDVGLGKTIEAGLIASELLLRKRVREIVVACPPSMLAQWKDELEARFGLTFEIFDREYVDRVRRERGISVNPWKTFPRFLVSHRLLIEEGYASQARDWLGASLPGSLLILDEAHHAAPASGTKYAVDSKITRAIRDLAPRFEHRLFLSATPHNGHSNSFSALMELLDPHRFTRGVPISSQDLKANLVRRLKEDIREIAGGFPKRIVRQIDLRSLAPDTPELLLSVLLERYRVVRMARLANAAKRQQIEAMLLLSGLQQRLLSSVEAFARTLAVHRRGVERVWATTPNGTTIEAAPLAGNFDADDERSTLPESEQQALLDATFEQATQASQGDAQLADVAVERQLLDQMQRVAEVGRGAPDARIRYLLSWMQQHLCAAIGNVDTAVNDKSWMPRRVLIFTEYEDTKRYLFEQISLAIAGTEQANQRMRVFHGPTPLDQRELLKRAFNAPPETEPLRILIATDAAREGLNLQAYCYDLFHFDLPWNPSRLEQRNGRIDRKLQRNAEVYCHYFVYTQRAEDRVLQALVKKTEAIRLQLGGAAQVLETRLANLVKTGIQHAHIETQAHQIDALQLESERQQQLDQELEHSRLRQADLQRQVDSLRDGLDKAKRRLGLESGQLQDAVSCALNLLGAQGLANTQESRLGVTFQPKESFACENGRYAAGRMTFPDLEQRFGSDPSWNSTLAGLRERLEPTVPNIRGPHTRALGKLRAVTFEAPENIDDSVVQLHLEHRLVKRLLGRFMAQGFVHHDLSRAVLASADDAIPRVVLIGRLAVFGQAASRLHEELITVTARWSAPEPGTSRRLNALKPYASDAEAHTLRLLEAAMAPNARAIAPQVSARLHAGVAQDVEDLLPHLHTRAEAARAKAETLLQKRAETESSALVDILHAQRKRVLETQATARQMTLFADAEARQFESDQRYWQRWLSGVELELIEQPSRIRGFYQTSSSRIEPIALAYLWPVSG